MQNDISLSIARITPQPPAVHQNNGQQEQGEEEYELSLAAQSTSNVKPFRIKLRA